MTTNPPRVGPPGGVSAQVLPVGGEGLLVEVATLDDVLALDAALREAVRRRHGPWQQVSDVVPAARTVLLLTREGADLVALRSAVLSLCDVALGPGDSVRPEGGPAGETGPETAPGSHEVEARSEVEIVVRYDGPDLADVARFTGLHPTDVVLAHTSAAWQVAFGGFVPGFGYLVGGDPRLRVPRRGTPRPSVAAGSVGLAGEFSGVYPRSSPGGWQLIGTTDAVLWDPTRVPPALFAPGTTVRFVDLDATLEPRATS